MHKRTAREVRTLIKQHGTATSTVQKPVKNSSAHQIHEYLHLVSNLGADSAPLAPALHILPQETDAAIKSWGARIHAAFPSGSQTADPLWLGLSPSSAYGTAKCWPPERFAATAQAVAGRFNNAVWLVFGTTKERAECERVVQLTKGRILNIAGQTSLRELMVLLKLCRVVLTNDSGPMHVAAALGTPVVVPFGSTAPELTGPGLPGNTGNYLLQAGAPCSPCFRRTCPVDFRCMTGIEVDQAAAAILKALATD
jgi:heptosyltransferase-2